MLKRIYPNTNRTLKLTSILIVTQLMSGCVSHLWSTHNTEEQEKLIEAQQAIQEQQAELDKKNRSVTTELAKLDKAAAELESAREQLAQDQRKLAVLKKSIQPDAELLTATSGNTEQLKSVLVGQLEPVYLEPPGLTLTARIDTGAETSSLNAVNLVKFERDGKRFVKFQIVHPETGEQVELTRRVLKYKKIKKHQDEPQTRPVVKMRAVLGEIDQRIEFTLIDRSNFRHQLLIGRNFLNDYAVVDVSKKSITQPVIQ